MKKQKWKILAGSFLGMLVAAVACCLIWTRGGEQKDLRFQCNYEIEVDLDLSRNLLIYSEQVLVRNEGSDNTSELYFHLYANKELTEENRIEVVSVTDENGEAVQVRGMNESTLFRVRLNAPLKSGEMVILTFQCQNILPTMRASYGVARDGEIQLPDFHLQLAVYDERGWDIAPLCENGDGRYSETADYIINLTVPSEYQAVCTGVETAREEKAGRTTYRFEAEKRREIMIAAFTDYMRLEQIVGNTTIIGYFNTLKVNRKVAEEAMDAAAFAMEYFNENYMEYPCETMILTNAGWATKTVANMEYSGHITVGMGENVDISTVYHEVAHQWFYFLVGNDENREAWLDESFAAFSANLCLEAAGEQKSADTWWDFYREIAARYPGQALNFSSDKMGNSYMDICYHRGPNFLKEIMDAMGRENFFDAVSEYCDSYMYRTATTEDFLDILRAHTETDLSELIDEYIK